MSTKKRNGKTKMRNPVGSSELLGGIQETVWVCAWMHRGTLGRWKFHNVTMLEAVTIAKALLLVSFVRVQLQIKTTIGGEPVNPFEIKNSFGQGIEFRASNKYLYACTKRAFAS